MATAWREKCVLDLTFDCSPSPPPTPCLSCSINRCIFGIFAPRSRALRTRLSRNALTITARC